MIYEYLTDFSKASLAIWLVALLTTSFFRFLFPHHFIKRSSFEPVLFLTILMACLQICWELLIGSMFGDNSLKELVAALWYLGFALSDWVLLFVLFWVLKRFSIASCYCTDTILISYAVMGLMQLVRYCDRYILELNSLGFFYKNGIPAINCIITIVVIGQAISICHGLLKSTKEVS